MVLILIGTVAFVACLVTSNWVYRSDLAASAWKPVPAWAPSYAGIIRSDGIGYLAWTYSIGTGDLCFAEYIQETLPIQPQAASGFHYPTTEGCFLPQYTLGQGAIWAIPVLGLRLAVTITRGSPPGSWITNSAGLGIMIGSAFMAAVGICALIWTLRRRVGMWLASIATISTFVGMYGFHYATFDGQFSHATSFGLFGLFIALTAIVRNRVTRLGPSTFWAIALGLDIALIGLVRLPNLLIVLVYLVIAFWQPLKAVLRHQGTAGSRRRNLAQPLVLMSAVAFLGLLIQPILWHAASGIWVPKTYVGQGFTLSTQTPVIIARILADPTWHGAIMWSPILIVAVLGFAVGYRRFGYQAIGSIAAIATMILTAATWTFPSGGGGLGLRFLVDVSPFIAVGVAAAISLARTAGPRSVYVLIAAISICTLWSLSAMLGYWDSRLPITGAPIADLVRVVMSPHLP
jgi:hypothetical protein